MDSIVNQLILPIVQENQDPWSTLKSYLFYLLLLIPIWLISKFIIFCWKNFWKYMNFRNMIIEEVQETKRQAIAHQGKEGLEHAFNAHKNQKIELIMKKTNKLFFFDPLKNKILSYAKDLNSSNNFQQSQEVTEKFLKHIRKEY